MKNKRTFYSKESKRNAFIKIIEGESQKDAVLNSCDNALNLPSDDNKYASKMLYKWKNLLYKDNSTLHFSSVDLIDNELNDEMNKISDELLRAINNREYFQNLKDTDSPLY